MKYTLVFLIGLTFLSCDNSEENTSISDNEVQLAITRPTHNSTSKFTIEGMTCEIGCVRTVKSHLSKMEGVLDISMDFDTSRTIDFSTVQYDNRLISEIEMTAEIESIAGGLYSVKEVTHEKL